MVASISNQHRTNKTGNLQENGHHERMHLTLKNETTKLVGENFLQQQEKFDHFIYEYNNERPHQALQMKYSAEIYVPSTKVYRGLTDVVYLFHEKTITVTHYGRVCLKGKKNKLK